MGIWEEIEQKTGVGTKIPNSNQEIKATAESQAGDIGWAYFVNRDNDSKQDKRVYSKEFQLAFDHLIDTGSFTRSWFRANLPRASSDGCNFKFIGGVFELLGYAIYAGDGSGRFISTKLPNS